MINLKGSLNEMFTQALLWEDDLSGKVHFTTSNETDLQAIKPKNIGQSALIEALSKSTRQRSILTKDSIIFVSMCKKGLLFTPFICFV